MPTRIGVIEVMSTPAAQVFKVGDHVRFKKRYAHCIEVGETGVVESCSKAITVKFPDNSPAFLDLGDCAEFLEHTQPSDTQQWVEWKGGERPVPADVHVEYRIRDGWSSKDTRTAGGLRWTHRDWPGDIVAFRVVQ